jgi:hypothetical protein
MVQALVYRAVRRPSTDAWHTRHVCASLPIVVVETLDAIARDTRRSRSAVITDALLAHPDIAAALTARGVGVSSDVPPVDSDDPWAGMDVVSPTPTPQGVDDAG